MIGVTVGGVFVGATPLTLAAVVVVGLLVVVALWQERRRRARMRQEFGDIGRAIDGLRRPPPDPAA